MESLKAPPARHKGSISDRLRSLRVFELLIFALMFVLFAISLSVLPIVAGPARADSFPAPL